MKIPLNEVCFTCNLAVEDCDCSTTCIICDALIKDHNPDGTCKQEDLDYLKWFSREVGDED